MEKSMKRLLLLIILTSITLLYTRPYFLYRYFPTHDGEWAIIRLAEMEREIKDGQIPPRWSDYLNHGYGYPLFSYTYPFPFYIGAALRIFHIGQVDAIKIIFVTSMLLSAFFMFLLGKELMGNFAGFISAIFYITAGYRFVNLYVRGSIGESISFALFPLLFFLGLKYTYKPNILYFILCSLTLAILILSHNIMSLVFFPSYIVFLIVVSRYYARDIKYYFWRYIMPMIILGLGLSSFFFLPAIFEKQYIVLSKMRLSDLDLHFINLSDYLFSSWKFGPIPSFKIGWSHIFAGIISIIGIITTSKNDKKRCLPVVLYILVMIFISIFLAHPISSTLWYIPPLSWLDFPWRLLAPMTFFIAFSTVFLSGDKTRELIACFLVVVAVFSGFNLSMPAGYIDRPDTYYATNDATTTSADELMPVWVINKPGKRYQTKVEIEDGKANVENLNYNSKFIKFKITSESPASVRINTVYFPGWQFMIDQRKIDIDYRKPDGLMRFQIPSGNYTVEGHFLNTPVRIVGNTISFFSFLAVLMFMFFGIWRRIATRCTHYEN
ncbi:hypothetical protein FJY90_02955 [Candidatus Gottesmanbacteria bacterium]|nr:hypothetical protein [Candidatus Gottesmanbacteria bacterium]